MTTNYVYIIQEREFIKTCEKIYKIGRSKQENNKRINQYPKQSILLFQIVCNNCDQLERELIKIFKKKYIHRKDIGNEYFEGDYEDMINTIYFTRNNIMDIISYEKKVYIKKEDKIKSDDEIFIEEFKKSFEIIKDENEKDKYYVKSVKITQWARLKKLKIYTSKSINIILREKFNYDTNDKSLYKCKKIDNKSVVCWFGLKEIKNEI